MTVVSGKWLLTLALALAFRPSRHGCCLALPASEETTEGPVVVAETCSGSEQIVNRLEVGYFARCR